VDILVIIIGVVNVAVHGKITETKTCGTCKGNKNINQQKPCVHSKTTPHFTKN